MSDKIHVCSECAFVDKKNVIRKKGVCPGCGKDYGGKAEQTCKICRHAEWQKTEKGNIRTSKPGTCKYEIKWPILPECYYDRKPLMSRSSIWPDEGRGCECFNLEVPCEYCKNGLTACKFCPQCGRVVDA